MKNKAFQQVRMVPGADMQQIFYELLPPRPGEKIVKQYIPRLARFLGFPKQRAHDLFYGNVKHIKDGERERLNRLILEASSQPIIVPLAKQRAGLERDVETLQRELDQVRRKQKEIDHEMLTGVRDLLCILEKRISLGA